MRGEGCDARISFQMFEYEFTMCQNALILQLSDVFVSILNIVTHLMMRDEFEVSICKVSVNQKGTYSVFFLK